MAQGGARTDLHAGSELLGYRIERVLGRGGMGIVYLAHQKALDRMVALKLLAPELVEDERFRRRFLDESKQAASLDHPNIVPVYDAGEAEGRLYIAMRYVEGTDLRRLLDEQGPLTPERAIAFLAPVADALDAAHAKRLVHRDVKPSNILVDEADRPYLADFGLSRRTAEHGLVETSHFTGSLDYVAPEQIENRPVSPATDQYALACVLYECLTGQPPFHTGSVIASLFGHVNDPPAPASERNARLPQAVDAVLARSLAKKPDERYPNCAELTRGAATATGLAGVARSRARRPILLAAIGIALLVAAGSTAFLLSRNGAHSVLPTPDSLVRIDPATNHVSRRIAVGHGARSVALGDGAVWVTTDGDSALWRVNPKNGATRRVAGLVSPADLVVVGSGVNANVYIGTAGGVAEFASGTSVGPVPVTGTEFVEWSTPSVSSGTLGVWASDSSAPAVERLGLSQTLGATSVVQKIPVARGPNEASGFNVVSGLAVGEGAVWATGDTLEQVLLRVDPRMNTVERFPLPSAPGPVATGVGAIWVAGQLADVVWRVDPRSGRVTDTITVGRGISDITAGAGSVWTTSAIDGTVTRIDPETRKVVATIAVGGTAEGIAASETGVWVTSRAT